MLHCTPKTSSAKKINGDENMNKTELVEKIAKETGLTKKDTEAALKSFIEVVTNELSKSGEVSLIGFGTFTTAKRAARTGINPKTKEQIKIPASKSPKFKPGKALKDAVNKK